jgi:hypothetical protein
MHTCSISPLPSTNVMVVTDRNIPTLGADERQDRPARNTAKPSRHSVITSSVMSARERIAMVSVRWWVRLEAKVGRERELEVFRRSAMPLVDAEAGTLVWFGVRLSSTTFGIFDAFADEPGPQTHLSGRVAAALGEHATTLLATPPATEQVDVLAVKLPK